jgi:hypothetical protein
MKPSQPIVIDGETYDLYTLNLAVTSKYLGDASEDASEDASIAMRLIPTRIQDGEVITAGEESRAFSIGTLAGADEITMQTAYAIQAAIQNYINVKGI